MAEVQGMEGRLPGTVVGIVAVVARIVGGLLLMAALHGQCGWRPQSTGDAPGASYAVRALTTWDPDGSGPQPLRWLVGGDFEEIGGVLARGLAAYDPQSRTFTAMDDLSGWRVHSVGVFAHLPNGGLAIGGTFRLGLAGRGATVLLWDGTQWSAPPVTPDGTVRAFTVAANGDLVVGGSFLTVGLLVSPGLARWNGVLWSPMSNGLTWPAAVYALATLPNGDIAIGGSFHVPGPVICYSLARWNGTAWVGMQAGANGIVHSLLTLPNGDLLAGGEFTIVAGVPCNRVARWNGTTWSPFGSGITGNAPYYSAVEAMALDANGDLLVSGRFRYAGGVAARHVAKWNGTAWSAFAGMTTWVGGNSDSATLATIAVLPSGGFVVGGWVDEVNGDKVRHIAEWNGSEWRPIGPGTNGSVCVFERAQNGDVLAGGMFSQIDTTAAARIARRVGGVWQPLGAGVRGGSPSLGSATVLCIAELANGDVVAGGNFTFAGAIAANHIARWNGSTWAPLGSGLSTPPRALAVLPNGDIVAGGGFTSAGGVPCSNIARWDGAVWSPLGAGVGGGLFPSVASLLVRANGRLAVGGAFTTAGGVPAANVAEWDGASWWPLGVGVASWGNGVYELGEDLQGNLLAVGEVDATAPQWLPAGVLRFDGVSWTEVGNTRGGRGTALAVLPDGDLVVATESNLAWEFRPAVRKLDRTGWQVLGHLSGGYASATDLLVEPDGSVLIAGMFQVFDQTHASMGMARLVPTCPATVADRGGGCAGSAGPNVLTALSLPWLGTACRAQADGMPANTAVVRVLGAAAASVPLASLLPQGLPGCTLATVPTDYDLHFAAAGSVVVSLAVPTTPSLAGVSLREQVLAFELDTAGAIQAVTASNVLELTIGAL